VAMTWIWVYLAAWAVTTAITFLVSRHFSDHTRSDRDIFAVSLLAGAVWPFVLIGVVELSSVAIYSTAETWLAAPDRADLVRDVVVPMR
jgi:hypothetical protein